jgi:mannosyl-oligosaccharide glucosidase
LGVLETDDPRFALSFRKMVDADSGMLTDYGVRSLSINDPFYRLGDNYWTSPIWMNINYLIISALNKYSLDTTVDEELRAEIAL